MMPKIMQNNKIYINLYNLKKTNKKQYHWFSYKPTLPSIVKIKYGHLQTINISSLEKKYKNIWVLR